MKQGRATSNVSTGQKREPIPHRIDICAVEDMGDAVAFVKPNLLDGRGYKAPMNVSQTTHKGGSQGRR